MLSLSPRYDLFRFVLPKDFLPEAISTKYAKIINRNPGVIVNPIDYLNESIKTISFPGISELNVLQPQHSSNTIKRGLGKINVEPKKDAVYTTSTNPLENIDKEFKVGFRFNQGLYNYFMIYETIFYRICKPSNEKEYDPVFTVDILNEDGNVVSKIIYKDVYIDGLEGIDFDYSKIDRDSGEFNVTFKFNNIDFDFVENL